MLRYAIEKFSPEERAFYMKNDDKGLDIDVYIIGFELYLE